MDNHTALLLFGVGYLLVGYLLRRHSWVGSLTIALGGLIILFAAMLIAHSALQRRHATSDPKDDETRFRLTTLQSALKGFRRDTGSYPDAAQGLRALFVNPGSYRWKGPYLQETRLTDGWGMPIDYRAEKSGYRLRSSGKDRRLETEDDVEVGP